MPHGARSACADQDPHKNPTTGRCRGLLACLAEGPRRRTQPGPRERNRASAPRGGDPVIELEYGITVYPARRPHFRAGEFRHKYAQSLGNISFEQWRSTFSQPVPTHVECIVA